MSSYPPPPPPGFPGSPQGAPGGYPPYDRAAWKLHRRALKQQARMQREQLRWQRRALRRGSLVGPLLILLLGVVFLLAQIGKISWSEALEWWGQWWPLVLVGAGLLLLLEWFVDQRLRSGTAGVQRPVRVVGGGVIFLLVVLALAGASSRWAENALAWKSDKFGPGFPLWSLAMGDRHDMDDTVDGAIAQNGALLIRNSHGDVTVTGSSDDGQVHVSVHKNIRAHSDQEAEARRERLQPVFSGSGASIVLDVPQVEGGNDDVVVQVPHNTALTVNADHGSVDVQEIHAPVSITAGAGEVNLNGISGAVSAHLNSSDTTFSAHSVSSGVTLEGRAGDINLSDIQGPVSLQGEFFGTTHVERSSEAVIFHTKRTQFQAARIDGELEIESGSDLQADSVVGPLVLQTAYRNITLNRVQGSVKVTNRDGSVTLTDAPPLGGIDITNQHGSVDVGLPANSGFVLNAQTHDGDIENDYGLNDLESNHVNVLTGTVLGGGPTVHIETSEGDVTVRKSTVAPLPPAPPAQPKITPAPSKSPAAPFAPRPPKVPKIPAKPQVTPTADERT